MKLNTTTRTTTMETEQHISKGIVIFGATGDLCKKKLIPSNGNFLCLFFHNEKDTDRQCNSPPDKHKQFHEILEGKKGDKKFPKQLQFKRFGYNAVATPAQDGSEM